MLFVLLAETDSFSVQDQKMENKDGLNLDNKLQVSCMQCLNKI